MSYARAIQPLVIEDEQDPKEYYEEVFRQLGERHHILPPRFAFCHADAVEQLSQDQPFHLIILDLRLPENPGQPPASELDLGLDILQKCQHRDTYPVPALLVISGKLQHANQQELMQQVHDGFSYGQVLVKSPTLETEIQEAVRHCQRYCDVGIHLRDSGDRVFPTLSPRDVDLLRRCALTVQSLGLDLEWWSAELSPPDEWTKVLLGRFALEKEHGQSLYSFFKLASSDGATSIFREAEVMGQKLKHVKMVHAQAAGNRSLLVTQAAGSGNVRPLSLDGLMTMPHASIRDALDVAAASIVEQVAALGDRTPDQRQISELLWRCHDTERLRDQWQRRGGEQVLAELNSVGIECPNPIDAFQHLQTLGVTVRYQRQGCRHGDLNYTNVAIEKSASGSFDAYVFDASGCTPGASVRDLAMLEVTTLLHQPSHDGRSIVERCKSLYSAKDDGHDEEQSEVKDQIANTLRFVTSLRAQAESLDEMGIYALLVFDNALMQLGGLDFGSSFNKIHEPRDAVYLAVLSCRWLMEVAPDYFEV